MLTIREKEIWKTALLIKKLTIKKLIRQQWNQMAIKISTHWIQVPWLTTSIYLFTNICNSKDPEKDEKPQ